MIVGRESLVELVGLCRQSKTSVEYLEPKIKLTM